MQSVVFPLITVFVLQQCSFFEACASLLRLSLIFSLCNIKNITYYPTGDEFFHSKMKDSKNIYIQVNIMFKTIKNATVICHMSS